MGGAARDAVSPSGGLVAGPDLRMASMSPQASALVRGMALGRHSALEQFYDRYIQLVYNLVLRIVRNRADADEVVQRVFLQVWREASRYDPDRGSPDAWVVTLARTRALDALRAARRTGEHVEARRPRDIADPEASGAAHLPERQSVMGALDELAPAQRELLELAYYEGLTQTEIAARTGLPLGTVKTRIRTGLDRLREVLRGKEWVVP
jgi:RNA polymerase sigma-70 factor, ECF subfamily